MCLLVVGWLARERHRSLLTVPPTDGVSQALAADRAQNLSALRYQLALSIPARKQDPIRGRETLQFELADASRPLLLDFAQPADRIIVSSLSVGGRAVPVESVHGHLVIPAAALHRGANELSIHFTAGDLPLNRNDNYAYSLFVPARASKTFPCFDQPDLKGAFALTLEMPSDWQAVANGAEIGRETAGNRVTVRFAATQLLPTYLFGFAVGRFAVEQGKRNGRPFHIYHRETDTAKVAQNLDAIFNLHG